MKKISFALLLTVSCPNFSFGYEPIIQNVDIRNNSYSVDVINNTIYNNALDYDSLNNGFSPVFRLKENNNFVYYKWVMPDLMQYKTSENQDIFSLIENGNYSLQYLSVDSDGNVTENRYYYTDINSVGSSVIDEDGVLSYSGDFVGNTTHGAIHLGYQDATDSITGNFINNKAQNVGGAIYNSKGYFGNEANTINSINGNFVGNGTYCYNDNEDANRGGGAIFNSTDAKINNITGSFIGNYAGSVRQATYGGGAIYNDGDIEYILADFTSNGASNSGGSYSIGGGGAIYNKNKISLIVGDFVNNRAPYSNGGAILNNTGNMSMIQGNFIDNMATRGKGGAIYNKYNSNIDAIIGNFYANKTPNGYGGAIYNIGNIGYISGYFMDNEAKSYDHVSMSNYAGGAIYNIGTMESITGFFENNSSGTGGAIYNEEGATLTLSNDVSFSNNIAFSGTGGAIYNLGNIFMNIDRTNSSIRFNSSTDDIYNAGTITANGTVNDAPGYLYLQSVSGSGDFNINNMHAHLAEGSTIEQTNFNIDENSILYTSTNGLNIANINNSGLISLTSGSLSENISTYKHGGNVDISGSIYSNADKIDIETTNNGTLTLTAGTLNNNIIGIGNVIIDGNIVSNSSFIQSLLTINSGKSLRSFADNILVNNFINDGTLTLTAGTLGNNITGTGNIVIDGDVTSNVNMAQNTIINAGKSLTIAANNINSDILTNNGLLKLSGGTLVENISNYGNAEIFGDLYSNADKIDIETINNGTLTLTAGTLGNNITGSGNIVIDGDITSNVNIAQNTIINAGKSLAIAVDNIKNTTLVNNGQLWFKDEGILDKALSNYGNVGNKGTLIADASAIDQDIINNGIIKLTTGTLDNNITGTGNIVIDGDVTSLVSVSEHFYISDNGVFTTNGDLLSNVSNIYNDGVLNISEGTLVNNIIGGTTIIDNKATIESTNVSDIEMNGVWNINSEVYANNVNVNGVMNFYLSDISKDSSVYTGGKVIANDFTFGDQSKIEIVIGDNNLSKGESSGDIIVLEGHLSNYSLISQNNAKYRLDIAPLALSQQGFRITLWKDEFDLIKENNGNENDMSVAKGWIVETESDNSAVQQIINKLNYNSQYNVPEYLNMLRSIAPTSTNISSTTSRIVNDVIYNQVFDRLSSIGHNGGDIFDGIGVWGQGVYNNASQSGENEFKGNTFGFSLGADKKFSNNTIFGLGYSLSNSSATAGDRNIDATGHTVFLYGEYRPYKTNKDEEGNITSKTAYPLYFNAMLSYGMTNYEDKAGYGISSDYSTNTIGLNGNVGYDINDTIDLFVGARYLKISQNDYTDSLGQKISVKDDDIITARFGGRYTGKGSIFVPNAHLGLSYDIKSNNRLAVVNTEHSNYQISGDSINPFGVQTGLGFTSNISNWKLSLNYDLDWHPEFISHTGRIKVKYAF